jgi:hypothetical protein
VKPVLVQLGDAERGIAPVVHRGERDVARRAGWFLAVAPPSTGETSSRLERSPSMSSGRTMAEASFPA